MKETGDNMKITKPKQSRQGEAAPPKAHPWRKLSDKNQEKANETNRLKKQEAIK